MPKNTIIPASGGPGPAPPVPEQSIRFDRGRATNLRGYTPGTNESDRWVMSWWQKITGDLTLARTIWEARVDANNYTRFQLLTTGAFRFEGVVAGVLEAYVETQRVMVDVSNWHHCHFRFDAPGGFIQFSINGYAYPGIQLVPAPSIANIPGYVWMNTTAEHFIGSDTLNTAGFSGQIAEMHCVPALLLEPPTSFGVFNSKGVWERIVYAGIHGASGFYLTFGRTVDLGEDFSGNNNDFPTHTNGGAADQAGDWMERNYCTLDVNDHRSTGTIDEGGLEVAGGNAAVTMRPHFGEWYYEVNGVGTVWDTVISGDFDPIIAGPASVNFGQFPFVGVGPMGAEMTVNSNNFPSTSTDIARDYTSSIYWAGSATDPRIIELGDGQSTIYDIEYSNILHRCDFVWAKNGGVGQNWYQAHRLRNGAQVPINTTGAEETVNASGVITNLEDPGPGFEVTDGGVDNLNFNEFGNVYNHLGLRVRNYAQNIIVTTNDESDAEEIIANGDTDTGSSDLELGSEDGSPGADEQAVGMQFKDLRIPQGSTVLDAKIQFECDAVRNDQPNDLEIWCEDIDDAPEFSDGSGNFDITGRTKTSASALWSPAQWDTVQRRSSVELTTSFAGAADEVINRGGWASGNDLVAIIINESGGTVGRHEAESGNAGTPADANGPELQIKWRDPGVGAEIGFSLFTYTGIAKTREIMHGLPAIPELVGVKNLAGGFDWGVYCSHIVDAGDGEDGHMEFNTTAAYVASTFWDNAPAGGLSMRLGPDDQVNERDSEFAGFAMSSLPGFSKVFRYVGNGSVDGPEVYLGFKPRWLCVKRTQVAQNWVTMSKATDIIAAQNNQFNVMDSMGFLNTTGNFFNNLAMHAYASGFKLVDTDADVNAAGAEYIGFAFAEASLQNAKATN